MIEDVQDLSLGGLMPVARDLRLVFDENADDYDAVHLAYPAALIRALLERTELAQGARVLEVGCGTGQFTTLLAQEGLALTAIELGANLSRLAAAKLKGYPDVEVVHADFEVWEPKPHAYDLVVSAQAFHWIRPEIGYPKVHRALRSGGTLALIWNLEGGSDTPLHRSLEDVYELLAPRMTSKSVRYWLELHVWRILGLINSSERFMVPEILRFPWWMRYSSEAYLQLLRMLSDHLALRSSDRQALLDVVRQAIDGHGGTIERSMVSLLFLTKPRANAAAGPSPRAFFTRRPRSA